MSSLVCDSDRRREVVRQNEKLSGLDYLEVGPDQITLTVHFLGKAPHGSHRLSEKNVVIEGGRRIRDIKVLSATTHRSGDPEFDDTLEVSVNRPGDFSSYTLRVVARDSQGRPHPHPSFDPRYDSVEFNFKVDCSNDLDCATERRCPPVERDKTEIDYLAKDYTSFRQLILDRLALVMPDWRERHVPDIGIALVEVLAYAGDYLSYYQDAAATEAYLDTARQRISVRRHARLVDYQLHEGCNARTWVTVKTEGDPPELDPRDLYFITRPEDERLSGDDIALSEQELEKLAAGAAYQVFAPMTEQPIKLYQSHYEMHFYTWGDEQCCLDRGATSATLIGQLVRDVEGRSPEDSQECASNEKQEAEQSSEAQGESDAPNLHLKPGDVLIFEEVIGPKTGNPSDADPSHRHAVRLTRVEAAVDPLNRQAVVEIEWAVEDALPFLVCISALGPAPECKIIRDVSVARSNVILVDHGKRIEEDAGTVPVSETVESCDCEGLPSDTMKLGGPFRPTLKHGPITFAEPLEATAPAAKTLTQDVRKAFPAVRLTSDPAPNGVAEWRAQPDLLGSSYSEQHFVAEVDNDGRAHLRFGDGEMGRRPAPEMKFNAVYRAGNGTPGNVGAESIAHVIFRQNALSGVILLVRNPLPAAGGTDPEPIDEARLYAPHAFRQELQRAIIADDYRALVERDFKSQVQRASATLRWNGSRYDVSIGVDQIGKDEADASLLAAIHRRMHRYRRIGHDVHVTRARLVPLLIEMRVCVHPHYLRGHVEAALLDMFSNRILADGRKGFFHPDNLGFGDGIYLSSLVATAQAVEGVESVEVRRLERLGAGPNREIELGVLSLGPLEIAQVGNDPSLPENGAFTLKMGGGR